MGTLNDDIHVNGHLTARSMKVPNGTVTDDMVNGSADIAATKIQKPRLIEYGQSGTAAAATIPIYVCNGATATIQGIKAGSIVAAVGNATVTVDLKVGGVSVLSAVITLDSTNTARVTESGTVSDTSMTVGEWAELVIDVNAGTGTLPTGLFVQVEIFEDQP